LVIMMKSVPVLASKQQDFQRSLVLQKTNNPTRE
jgi:hypothetical protein